MTTPQQPAPPPQQPAPLPPERPPGGQAAAVSAQLDEDLSAITPAMAAFIAAVLAYARTGQRVAGLPVTVAKKIGYYALVVTALESLVHRNLELQRTWAGKRAAEELWEHQDAAVQAGVEAGLATLAHSATYIARAARVDEATGGSPGVSLPGEPYDAKAEDHAKTYADPEKIALPVVQTAKNVAQLDAAAAAGWQRKTWVSKQDNRVRVNHAFLNAKNYEYHTVPILEPFVTLDDNKLWYPGDTSAPQYEWMRCRCWLRLSK